MTEERPILAQGARELLVALATPSPQGHMGVPVLVWGAPGTGKSSFVLRLHREEFPVVVLTASIHDPTDFSGLPILAGERMRFAPPAWAEVFEHTGQGVLFLDELNTAPPAVQAALLRLALERKLGSLSLPPGVRVVAAANPPEVAASAWELSQPLANRFVHLHWQLDGNTYIRALEEGFDEAHLWREPSVTEHANRRQYWSAVVANFLRRNPQMVHTQPADGEHAFASPRTWDYAIALMATCDLLGIMPQGSEKSRSRSEVFLNLLHGCIGKGAATAFVQHLREMRMPDPEAVLRGKQGVPRGLREDELYTLFNTMAHLLLQWHKSGNDTQVSDGLVRFLETIQPVAEAGRADSAYVAIRRLVREGVLQSVLLSSPPQRRAKVTGSLKQLEAHYKELIGMLERE